MLYTIRHLTRFRYSVPISQSVMELRMEPRSEGQQRCLNFKLTLNPNAQPMIYRDYLGNIVHHFDVPGHHKTLSITADAQVEIRPLQPLPDRLPATAWDELAADDYDMLLPSRYTHPSPLLDDLANELGAVRRDDPLTLLCDLNRSIAEAFEYAPASTQVDSPIDDALRTRRGVCQDFTHIMIALARPLGIPCRYVSGYLYHRHSGKADRSAQDATHAWVEALLPGLGWVGFDPTNNLIATDRHIRVAVGRDYADVPPTRGVFKGNADTELYVGVRVMRDDDSASGDLTPVLAGWSAALESQAEGEDEQSQQQ